MGRCARRLSAAVGVAVVALCQYGCGRIFYEPITQSSDPVDASGVDGSAEPPGGFGCGGPLDDSAALVASYSFDASLSTFSSGAPNAQARGDFTYVEGPPGCGQALNLDPALDPEAYVFIDHEEIWNLREGSIDFWLRFDGMRAESDNSGLFILSRDANGFVAGGHLTIGLDPSQRLFVRSQPAESSGLAAAVHCSDETIMAGGGWKHIAVNFGDAIELYVDGVRQTYGGDLGAIDRLGDYWCSGDTASRHDISGNSNPWVIGRSGAWSTEGTHDAVEGRTIHAAIDHLRIRRAPIDFTALGP